VTQREQIRHMSSLFVLRVMFTSVQMEQLVARFVKIMIKNNFVYFYRCAVHSDICTVHSPTKALLLI